MLVVETGWFVTVVLIAIRLGVFLYASPFDGLARLPALVRIFLVFALALVCVAALPSASMRLPGSPFELLGLACGEVAVGALLGFGMHAVFAAFSVAGRLLDFQSGLGAGGILNPNLGEQEPLLGTFLSLLGLMLFYLSGSYLVVIELIVRSLTFWPPGVMPEAVPLAAIVSHLSAAFGLGILLALPAVMVLLLVDVGIAVMSRTMPQMNVYFLFLPLKVLLGVVVMAMSIRPMQPVYIAAFELMEKYWTAVLGQSHG